MQWPEKSLQPAGRKTRLGGDWVGKGSSSHPIQFPFLGQSTELIFLSYRSGSASLKNFFIRSSGLSRPDIDWNLYFYWIGLHLHLYSRFQIK